MRLVGFVLVLCACGERAAETPPIRVDGSSTVFPLSAAVAEEFGKVRAGTQVTVGISGTGGGFKKFCAGEVDVADASRPIKPSEVEACAKSGVEYVEVPVAYDGIAVVVHPKNDWATAMTVDELRRLWEPAAQGTVTRWSHVRPEWPDKEIHLYGAGVDSGTYDYFTEAIVGTEHASRGDYTSSEDDNTLVVGVSGDEAALGWFGLAYYESNKDELRLVAIDDGRPDNGAGPIVPTAATVRDGTYQPLSRPVFVYVAARALERPEVDAFVKFYLDAAPGLAAEEGYVPLPDDAYDKLEQRVTARRTGSVLGGKGSAVGVPISELVAP